MSLEEAIVIADEHTVVLSLKIPPHKIVVMQAIIESYEGLATMRTEDAASGRITLLSTPSLKEELTEFLNESRKLFSWEESPPIGDLQF